MRYLLGVFCFFLLTVQIASTKILFVSRSENDNGELDSSIYVMEDDGTGIIKLHTDQLLCSRPKWSPDGKQIVFHRRVFKFDHKLRQIMLMNADGTNLRPLTDPYKESDSYPTFSPDGTAVLFWGRGAANNDGEQNSCICLINLETGNITEIVNLKVNSPVMSPDGKHIVYATVPKIGQTSMNLWIMDANGNNQRELIPPIPPEGILVDRAYPQWSPDSQQIVYYQLESTFNPNHGFIPKAHRYFIYDLRTKQSREIMTAKKRFRCSGLDYWMDNGRSILFGAVEVELNKPGGGPRNTYHFYKYHIATGKTTRLSDQMWRSPSMDWISDDVFSVSSKGKLGIKWGELKSSLSMSRDASR